jgi:methylated-DNA-[protein]-cysteine S-methyltransferase
LEGPKNLKASLKLFPFSFELTYLLDGRLSRVTFNLYLHPERSEILFEEETLRIPVAEFLAKLRAYLQGRISYIDLPHHLKVKDFTRKVLSLLREIPPGKTLTYQEMAGLLKCPKAVRAVAKALASNPLPLLYPCHRIISKKGLGGFSQGMLLKWLLLHWERTYKNFDMKKASVNFLTKA